MAEAGQRIELVDRHTRVGASDVPALFGLCPFKTRRELFLSKINPKSEDEETKIESACWYGNHLEDAIIAMTQEKMGLGGIEKQVPLKNGILHAHPDAVAQSYTYRQNKYNAPCVLEIKTTGFKGDPIEQWGRAGSKNGIPVRIFIQVQAQLTASQASDCKCDIAFISLLSGHDGRGLSLYPVRYNPRAGAKIMAKVNSFWSDVLAERSKQSDVLTVEDL